MLVAAVVEQVPMIQEIMVPQVDKVAAELVEV
jgi:hypothetical protein